MSNFELNVPITTADNHVQVTPTPGEPLRPGRHVFQLIVEDQAGNRSLPATIEVIVRDTTAPTAVLRLVVPEGEDPETWQPRESDPFELSADGSSDLSGGALTYHWTLVAVPPAPPPDPEPTPPPPEDPTPPPDPDA